MKHSFDNQLNIIRAIHNGLVLILITVMTGLVLDQANPLLTKLGRDSGVFLYVSSYLLKNGTLYEAAWENKGPVLFFINALGLWLGQGTRWGIWAIEFIFLFGASITGFSTIKKLYGFGPAIFSLLVWMSGLNNLLSGGNFSEEYSLFFGFASLALFKLYLDRPNASWIGFLIGLCTGLSFMIRPNNIGAQLSIIITLLLLKRYNVQGISLKQIGMIAAGGIILTASIFIYFTCIGSLKEFIEALFIYNLSLGSRLNIISSFEAGIANIGFGSGIAFVGVAIVAVKLAEQIRNANPQAFLLWICINIIIEICLSGLSGQNYEHYFINWLPFIALASAYLINYIFPEFTQWVNTKPILFPALLIMILVITRQEVIANYWRSSVELQLKNSYIEKVDHVAEYVYANTLPHETVLVWGGQYGINFLANRDAPSPYLFYPYYIKSAFTNRISEKYYDAIIINRPTLIVDGSYYVSEEIIPLSTNAPKKWFDEHQVYEPPYLEEFFLFFRKNYSWVDNINGVDIYRIDQ